MSAKKAMHTRAAPPISPEVGSNVLTGIDIRHDIYLGGILPVTLRHILVSGDEAMSIQLRAYERARRLCSA